MSPNKYLNADNLLILQSFSFLSLILVPTIARKVIDITILHLSIEEILAIVLTISWSVVITAAFVSINYNVVNKTFYLLMISGLVIASLGLGIHLVGNHFNDHLFVGEKLSSDISDAAYFYDETFGHYLTITGYFIIIFAFVLEQANFICQLFMNKAVVLFAILNGVGLSILSIEGQVVPFSILITILISGYNIKKFGISFSNFRVRVCNYYFTIVLFVNLVLIILWGIANGGFPEFTQIGII